MCSRPPPPPGVPHVQPAGPSPPDVPLALQAPRPTPHGALDVGFSVAQQGGEGAGRDEEAEWDAICHRALEMAEQQLPAGAIGCEGVNCYTQKQTNVLCPPPGLGTGWVKH